MKSNGGGVLARRAWLGFVCLAAGGCCTEVPRAEKFFDRRESPVQTLRGFVYAVDTSQWDYAFECLSSTSKAEITPFKLEAAIRWAKDPVYHEVWVRDLISSCLDRKRTILLDGGRAFITVTTGARGRQGPVYFKDLRLVFVREEGEWRFGLDETLAELQQGANSSPAPDV